MVKLFYITYISVGLAQHELFHANVSMGGIKHIFWMLKREMVLIEMVLLSTHYRVLRDAELSILGR